MGRAADPSGHVSVRYATDLLRSLVGVADARVVTDVNGAFQCLEVVPEAGVADHAVVRNVASALRATLDIHLGPESVRVVTHLPQLAPAGPTHLVVLPGGTPTAPEQHQNDAPQSVGREAPRLTANTDALPHTLPQRAEGGRAAASHGNLAYELSEGHARRISLDTAEMHEAALPHLESVELDRDDRRMRCRVVIAAEGQRHAAMAVGSLTPGAEVTIGARAAVDALRAVGGRLAELNLESASLTHVGGRPHVIAAVNRWSAGQSFSLAGTAAVSETPEKAAALAVLRAALQSTETEH